MNNFKTTDDFFGNLSVEDMQCSMEMLFLEAGKFRARLGEQAHLLDEYLVTHACCFIAMSVLYYR